MKEKNKQNQKTTKASQESPFNKGAVSEADWGFLNSRIQPLNSNAKGITLIALIITIIVMLILVLTAVSVTMNSGLFEKAAKAGEDWNEAENNLVDEGVNFIDEQVALATKGTITTIIAPTESENEYIKNNENITEVVQTKTASKTYEAPIPNGFKASRVTGEGAIDTGLVIYENETEINDSSDVATAKQTYNQFVWIPVEEVEDMYICHVFNSAGTTAEATACKFELAEVTENGETVEKIKCSTHNSYDMAGYLYTNAAMTTRITSYTPNSGQREPGVVDGSEDGTGTSHDKAQSNGTYTNLKTISDILGTTGYDMPDNFEQTLQEDYNKIATSILKYKGFYVGRYESSNIKATDTGSLIVQAGKIPTNETNWYTMYAKQKAYKINDEAVGSTMINGAAYDQVIKFVATDPSYDPYKAGQVGHTSEYFTTKPYLMGGVDYNSNYANYVNEPYNDYGNNIYDLEGNITAWTTEAGESYGRFYRGRLLRKQIFIEPSLPRTFDSRHCHRYRFYVPALCKIVDKGRQGDASFVFRVSSF